MPAALRPHVGRSRKTSGDVRGGRGVRKERQRRGCVDHGGGRAPSLVLRYPLKDSAQSWERGGCRDSVFSEDSQDLRQREGAMREVLHFGKKT